MKTLVIQSCSEESMPEWIKSCLATVAAWCEARGFDRRFIGDAIFDSVPGWYMDKTGKGPVATDYARLVLLQEALDQEDYDQVIWLDADVYVLDAEMVLETGKSCAFGQEFWIQDEDGKLKVRRNVHNAVCLFRKGCVVLPFLLETIASIIGRADPSHIAPQMVGPKLLSALHSLHEFSLLPQVGAISPEVARDIRAGGGAALELLLAKSPVPLQAVNLCASLLGDREAGAVIDRIDLLRQDA